ncbi:cytochrome c biogenesis protein ResB [Nigerium massiliense]|uniref:cytochrome c biogenesis protein ResB n=1 Tax=Nigerium massiliense TaxID=1522317 RepID=UPI000694CF39|nr:cytochrome c biogenesis protein ResB [Nigerium massiliense]
MSHTIDAVDPVLADPDRPPTPGRGRQHTVGRLARRVYAFFYNKRFGLALILAMCLFTLLGVLFQQAPDGVRDDPQQFAQWLDSVRPRYRGWTDPLAALGVFNIFSSLWFKATTILLALSILACTCHRIPLLWRQATQPHLHVTDNFFAHARLTDAVHLDAEPDEALAELSQGLRQRRFRLTRDKRGPGLNVYADRNRFAPFGTALAHLAFITILLGVFVSSVTGFMDQEFTVTVGTSRDVGHGTGLSVRADAFSDTYYPDGRPKDYVAGLTLFKDGQQVAQQDVRVNSPLDYDGVTFNQSYFGVAAEVAVADASGREVFREGVPLQWQTEDQKNSYGKFAVPGQDLEAYVVSAASGQVDENIGAGQMRLEIYRQDSTTPIATQVVTQGQPARIGDLTYTFVRERQFTGLMVSRDPGAPWVYAGLTLLLLGTCLTMFLRHHRVWLRVTPDADGGSLVRAGSPDRYDYTFETWFHTFFEAHAAPGTHERSGRDA